MAAAALVEVGVGVGVEVGLEVGFKVGADVVEVGAEVVEVGAEVVEVGAEVGAVAEIPTCIEMVRPGVTSMTRQILWLCKLRK